MYTHGSPPDVGSKEKPDVKIVFVVACPQGGMCGVGDYTERLAAALRESGAPVAVEFLKTWSFGAVRQLRRAHGKDRGTIIHLQYPSLTMGKSPAPALLPLMFRNVFVTLHEFRIFSLSRKLLLFPYSVRARGIIFSNAEERSSFRRFFRTGEDALHVMPIGMNIPRSHSPALSQRREKLIYFGQIAPNKGIETFLETVKILRAGESDLDVSLVGAVIESSRSFAEHVRKVAADHDISLKLDLTPEAVSTELGGATLALLPFPEGVSNKRGSALACLDHGVTVLTVHSGLTPDWLRRTTYPISSPDDAAARITELTEGKAPRAREPDVLAHELAARDWAEIGRAHVELYRQVLRD